MGVTLGRVWSHLHIPQKVKTKKKKRKKGEWSERGGERGREIKIENKL
jgi:hypothetical protein